MYTAMYILLYILVYLWIYVKRVYILRPYVALATKSVVGESVPHMRIRVSGRSFFAVWVYENSREWVLVPSTSGETKTCVSGHFKPLPQ